MPRKPKNPESSIPMIGDEAVDTRTAAPGGTNAALEAELAKLRFENEKLKAAAIEAPLIREAEKPRASGTVTVACKIEMGLKLQLQRLVESRVGSGRPGDNSYVIDKVWTFHGDSIHVFGPALPAQVPQGYIMPKGMEGGYALTPGVPAAFWAEWLEQNKEADYVKNRMIFAMDDSSTKHAAREHEELKSGIQPLSQDTDKNGRLTDKRVPKPMNANVARIAYDAERDAARAPS